MIKYRLKLVNKESAWILDMCSWTYLSNLVKKAFLNPFFLIFKIFWNFSEKINHLGKKL